VRTHRPPNVVFDRKIAIVLDENMTATTAIVVAAHLALSLGKHADDLMGEQITDRSANVHLSLAKYPVVLLRASPPVLKDFVKEAKAEGVLVVDFPRSALDLWTDAELASDLQRRTEEEIDFWGAAIYAIPQIVNRHTGSMALFRPQIP
jgi:hypothetical protein